LPDKITVDDAMGVSSNAQRITFDDALEDYESKVTSIRPGLGGLQEALDAGAKGEFKTHKGRAALVPRVLPPENANFLGSIKQGIPEDIETRRKVLAESLFPDDPKGIERIGFMDDRPVYVDDNGDLRYVSAGLSRAGAGLVSSFPEIAGSVIGSFATGNPVTGSAVGGAGGRALKRGISALVFDEPVATEGVATEMATEAGVNLAGGTLGKGLAKFAGRGRAVDFTPAEIKTAEQARELIKTKTGIDVDLAQASGNRKLIGLRAYAARFPGKSAEIVQAADEVAEGQLDTAVNRTLDLVAKATPQETAYTNGVTAAQMVIKTAREKVYNEVRPLYQAAYTAVPEVNSRTILDYLKLPYFQDAFRSGQTLRSLETGSARRPFVRNSESSLSRNPDGSYRRATRTVDSTSTGASKVSERLTEGSRQQTPEGVLTRRRDQVETNIERPSLEELDYTKRALDEKIESLIESGSRQRARALKMKRDEFVAALDALPNQQWQLARKRYGDLIKETVEPLEQGPIGVLAKIENPRFASRAAQVLSDRNITPEWIKATRDSIESAQPGAWNGLVREYISLNWNKALKETQGGQVVNPAGKLRQALIGTPRDKARMEAMLPPAAVKSFDDLMTASEALARTPISGSNTMRDTEIANQLKGNAALVFRWLTSPRQSIREAAEQKALERATVAITEGIIDPTKRGQLRQVVKMAPSTRQALLITGILTGQGTQEAATTEPDVIPEAFH
jgi:hypothetical protein